MINFLFASLLAVLHPFYVSVTDIEYKGESEKLEISCRMFFDDLEDALAQDENRRVNMIKPADRLEVDKLLSAYITKNLMVQLDGSRVALTYLGYEIEEDAAWCYLEATQVPTPKNITIQNTLLYRSHDKQSNIMHISVNGDRKSIKLDNPKGRATFEFK